MRIVSLLCLALAAACGGSGATNFDTNLDPRCATLCENEEQAQGSGITCTDDSVSACKNACAAKIYGVSTLCANCLLEGANFYGFLAVGGPCSSTPGGTSSCGGDGLECKSSNGGPTTCTSNVNGVQCSYDPSVPSQVNACLMKQYPDGTTSCETHFHHALKDCTAFCTGA